MTQVLERGESVHQCDVCQRYVRLPTNSQGLDVIQRCIITKNCSGSLHRILNSKRITQTPSSTPAVDGVDDWFQRNVIFTHTQVVGARKWIIAHNFGNVPVVQVFVQRVNGTSLKNELVETTDCIIESTSTTTVVTFTTAQQGVAQCLSLSSASLKPEVTILKDLELLTNAGELTIATLDNSPSINITLSYVNTEDGSSVDVTYGSVDNSPSVKSPWAGTSIILLNGKQRFVRSFNIITTFGGSVFFSNSQNITNGLQVNFPSLAANHANENVILFGKPPFATVDKVLTEYLDVGYASDGKILLDNKNLYTGSNNKRSTYPPIALL